MLRRIFASSLLPSSRQLILASAARAESTLTDGPIEKSMNQVLLLGRVGGDPVLKGTDAHPVVLFSLATNTNYKSASDGGVMKQKTDWHRVSLFKPFLRDLALANMRKGSRILVTGRISYGEVVDSKGIQHQSTTIIADDLIFLARSSRGLMDQEEEVSSG